ncbi:MAG: hypothetical protein M3Z08_06585 [Chloroflexota bacterium]|nr:hypothetical protein [Chloroflexota bacterium]
MRLSKLLPLDLPLEAVPESLLPSTKQVVQVLGGMPLALDQEFLHLCAFLHPDHIPEEIITSGLSSLGMDRQSALAGFYQLDEIFATLRSFSLISRHAETHSFSLHRLVQVVIRDIMEPTAVHQWFVRAVQALNTVFPVEAFTL